jgi:hypothetical protein
MGRPEPLILSPEQKKLYAIAFIHSILNEDTPDLTNHGKLNEEDVKAYVNENIPLGYSKEELERMDIEEMPTGTTDNVPTVTSDNVPTVTSDRKRSLDTSGGKKSKKNKSKKSRKSRKHRK